MEIANIFRNGKIIYKLKIFLKVNLNNLLLTITLGVTVSFILFLDSLKCYKNKIFRKPYSWMVHVKVPMLHAENQSRSLLI